MTYFECEECGHLADFVRYETQGFLTTCPVCEERTRWTAAFDDPDSGVTF